MTIEYKPVKSEDVISTIDDSANQIAFLNTALIAMGEHDYDVDNSGIMGLQSILFMLEENLRGVNNCLRKNRSLLMQQEDKNIRTPQEDLEAYLAQQP